MDVIFTSSKTSVGCTRLLHPAQRIARSAIRRIAAAGEVPRPGEFYVTRTHGTEVTITNLDGYLSVAVEFFGEHEGTVWLYATPLKRNELEEQAVNA